MALIPRIAAVSYLNTIPFIYGIRHAGNLRAELLLTPPALCASNFIDGNADIALLPSAVVPRLKDAELVTDFCIGAEGEEEALTFGVERIYEAVQQSDYRDRPYAYDYLTRNIDFLFDNEKRKALQKFWTSGVKVTPLVEPG